jgi:hypothetical protein
MGNIFMNDFRRLTFSANFLCLFLAASVTAYADTVVAPPPPSSFPMEKTLPDLAPRHHRESFAFSYPSASGREVRGHVEYEIVSKTIPLPDGSYRRESFGHAVKKTSEDRKKGRRMVFEGSYRCRETLRGTLRVKKGIRRLKITETQMKNPSRESDIHRESLRVLHLRYQIKNNREIPVSLSENSCQTEGTFWDPASLAFEEAVPPAPPLKKTYAKILHRVRTYGLNGRRDRTFTDLEVRESRFNKQGHPETDKTQNVFVAKNHKKKFPEVKTRYERTTEYYPRGIPKSMIADYEVFSPKKNRFLSIAVLWSANGNLEKASKTHLNSREKAVRKTWTLRRGDRAIQPGDPGKNTLSVEELLRSLTMLQKWEKDFVSGSLPLSPFAFPDTKS